LAWQLDATLSVEDMKTAIWANLNHKLSTNEASYHELYPRGNEFLVVGIKRPKEEMKSITSHITCLLL
jgi:hypothetical protein